MHAIYQISRFWIGVAFAFADMNFGVFRFMARSILWLSFGAFMNSHAPYFVLLLCHCNLLISLIFHVNTIPNLNSSSMQCCVFYLLNTKLLSWTIVITIHWMIACWCRFCCFLTHVFKLLWCIGILMMLIP